MYIVYNLLETLYYVFGSGILVSVTLWWLSKLIIIVSKCIGIVYLGDELYIIKHWLDNPSCYEYLLSIQ